MPPLLLLHGFTFDRASFASPIPGAAALAVDLPGPGIYSFAACVDSLAAHGVRDVIGYSMGARVALAHALSRPDLVRRLVLISGSPGLRRRKERVARRLADAQLAREIERDGADDFLSRWDALPLFGPGARARVSA
jgi:2-succinyl-6-hydroxy-2,4-cyclohexadiene-1-carboxylate synthase